MFLKIPSLKGFIHSYYDHVPLYLGESGTALVTNSNNDPVVACGQPAEGRYIAWGMATGLGAGDRETAPTGAEKTLLIHAVRWAGQR